MRERNTYYFESTSNKKINIEINRLWSRFIGNNKVYKIFLVKCAIRLPCVAVS